MPEVLLMLVMMVRTLLRIWRSASVDAREQIVKYRSGGSDGRTDLNGGAADQCVGRFVVAQSLIFNDLNRYRNTYHFTTPSHLPGTLYQHQRFMVAESKSAMMHDAQHVCGLICITVATVSVHPVGCHSIIIS